MPGFGVLASDSTGYQSQQAGLRRIFTDLLSVLPDRVGRPRSSILLLIQGYRNRYKNASYFPSSLIKSAAYFPSKVIVTIMPMACKREMSCSIKSLSLDCKCYILIR